MYFVFYSPVERGLRFYIFVILLLVVSFSYFINALEADAISLSYSYPNNTYVTFMDSQLFKVTCNSPGDGMSFDVELFINDTRYGITNIPGGPSPRILIPNKSVNEGTNYSWYVTVTNGSAWNSTNLSDMRYFTLDQHQPTVNYNGFWSTNNNTYQSSTDIYYEVLINEVNFANASFTLLNGTSRTVLHTINITDMFEPANFSDLTEGYYLFFVNATDLATNHNSSVVWKAVSIDLTPPSVINAKMNNTFTSNTTVSVICNTSDNLDLSNISVFTDFNGTWLLNQTLDISGLTNSTTFNNVTEGVHLWTCNVSDNIYSTQNTSNYTVTVDVTSPIPTITLGASTITTAQTVSISCSGSDAIDTSVDVALSIMKPGESSYSVIFPGTYSDVSTTGTYTVQCIATDDAANTGTTTSTFTVSAVSESPGGSGGSSGSGSSGVSVSTGNTSKNETGTISLTKRIRRAASIDYSLESYSEWVDNSAMELSDLTGGDVYTFLTTTDSETHKISILHVDSINSFVVIAVESEFQVFRLTFTEPVKELDLNGDGRNDLRITLIDFVDDSANIYIEKIDGIFRASGEETSVWVWILTLLVTLGVSVGVVYLLTKPDN